VSGSFVWRDAGRVVVLRDDAVAQAPRLLQEHGFADFELLTTPRALPGAPELEAAAKAVHAVPDDQVPEIAAGLLERVGAAQLVALGGGRVVDTAKAVASVSGVVVAAVPTTLSGAEMTGIHRLPAGAEQRARGLVRAALVIADPVAMTGLPEQQLRASAVHALAHGADSLYTPFANPVSRMAALSGAEAIATALDQQRAERDRALLAQGAILSGYAIDSGAFGMHHVICQTLVRLCGTPHAETNATILPRVLAFMLPRAPDRLEPLAAALGTEPDRIEARTRELGGDQPGLGDLGGDRGNLDQALESMLLRPELAFTPEPPTRDDLAQLVEAAW
jgi:alcohol dehydrogenase class IV